MTSTSRFAFLKAQPAIAPLKDPDQIRKTYSYWRTRSLYSTFVGYAIYYICRKNLSAATPAMIAELGLSKTAIGSIWSMMYLVYGVSKLVSGVLGDRANARYFMAIGLFLSALTNIAFGLSSSLVVFGLVWALNGWFQAMGGPTSARILTHWFSPNELGTKWGIWNISHQIGGGFVLVLAGYLTEHYGWRSSFFVPAAIGIIGALFLVNRLRDTPPAMGLPEIEDFRKDYSEGQHTLDQEHPVKDVLIKQVLRNKHVWFLALANFFVYIVRYGAMDWAPTFLVEVKGSLIASASAKTAAFEFMGIAGSFFAGWLSDRYFPGRRAWINIIYMLILVFALAGFWLLPKGYPVFDAVLLGAVGFLVYGPQMLVGVCAATAAGKHAAATANGMTGLFGYLGSIISGIGTGWIVQHYGWGSGFLLFIASALLGAVCFVATIEVRPAEK